MADLNASDGASAGNQEGVLRNLPRTRPQRSTPRRAAARNGARGVASAAAGGAPRARSRATGSAPRERATAGARPERGKAQSAAQQEPPLQGFECDSEASSGSVQPPGAVELLSSAAEVVGELAKAGVSRGERLLKDLASRLPLS